MYTRRLHFRDGSVFLVLLQVEAGASLVIRNLTVKNEGWVPIALSKTEMGEATGDEAGGGEGGGVSVPEAIQIRGFRFDKKAIHCIHVPEGER